MKSAAGVELRDGAVTFLLHSTGNALMPLGIYISIPFCRSKCSYCNFASGVFAREMMGSYVERVCSDIQHAGGRASEVAGIFDRKVDSIYFGGGTPTTLTPVQL